MSTRAPLALQPALIRRALAVATVLAEVGCGTPGAPTTTDSGATAPTSGESSASSTTSANESTSTSGATSAPASTSADPSPSTTDTASSGTEGSTSTTATESTSGSSTGGTAATTGQDATGSTGASSTGALLECDDYVGQATPEQTAITPQGDDEAEQLALEVSGEIVAPPAVFTRIAGDLKAIRASYPEVAGIKARAAEANDAISIRFTAAGAAQIADKTYHAWDCPNALYHVEQIDGPKSDFVTLTFDGLYAMPLIYADYLALDEVMKIFPLWDLDGDDVCAAIAGEAMLYIFDHGYGDCPESCTDHDYWGFTVDADTNVTPLGTYSTMDGVMAPAWLANAAECKKWL